MEREDYQKSFFSNKSGVSVWERLIAKSIDLVAIMVVLFLTKLIWSFLGVVVSCVICALFDSFGNGQSLGKKILGIRVLERSTLLVCGRKESFYRNIPIILMVFLFSVGLWFLFWLIAIPLVLFEIILLFTIESGIRFGDVLANTYVERVK